MQLLHLLTAFLAPLHILAFIQFTNNDFKGITAGQAFTLTWSADGTGPATITLMNGPITNLAKVATVAASATGTSFSWTPASTIEAGTYVLSIAQSGSTNYSPQFPIANGAPGPKKPDSPSPPPASAPPAPAPPASTSYPLLSTYPIPTTYPAGAWASFTKVEAQAAMVTGDVMDNGEGEKVWSSTAAWDDQGEGWCENGTVCTKKGGAVRSGAMGGGVWLAVILGGMVVGLGGLVLV